MPPIPLREELTGIFFSSLPQSGVPITLILPGRQLPLSFPSPKLSAFVLVPKPKVPPTSTITAGV
jgi:hypothetical protein